MPDSNNRTGRDFSKYDEMNDEQLRQILREDASKTEGEDTDLELMLHIMEVLARRTREANKEVSPEVALEQFKNKYTYTDNSLISEERPAKPKSKGFTRLQKWVATIAAVLILVFGTSLTAQALGFDIFEIIVKWTQETFHLGNSSDMGKVDEPSPNARNPYVSLQDALDKYQIEHKLVPSWIPEGYVEDSIETIETPKQRLFVAIYTRNESTIMIRIADYLNGYPIQIEQSEHVVEKIVADGVEYFVVENEGQLQVAWVNDRFECCITGDLSLSEIKTIIDSIEEG